MKHIEDKYTVLFDYLDGLKLDINKHTAVVKLLNIEMNQDIVVFIKEEVSKNASSSKQQSGSASNDLRRPKAQGSKRRSTGSK